jgi:hypothetical protein
VSRGLVDLGEISIEISESQENIFAPLEMKGSFYLTPDLKERMLTLTQRTPDGKLEHQAECKIIEQDHTKGNW